MNDPEGSLYIDSAWCDSAGDRSQPGLNRVTGDPIGRVAGPNP